MNILLWMLAGGVIGWLSSMTWIIDYEMGPSSNVVVGITGALIGGWLMALITGQGFLGISILSIIVSILGSIAFIGIMSGRRTRVGRGF